MLFARRLLRENAPRRQRLWWALYFVIANPLDFEKNFVKAWSENAAAAGNDLAAGNTYVIYVDDEELAIPHLPGDDLDKTRLKHLRMFYKLIQLRRGVRAIILPRTLVRIDWVQVSSAFLLERTFTRSSTDTANQVEDSQRVLGEKLETMDLGRRAGRFSKPTLIEDNSKKLTEQETKLKTQLREGVTLGIEFVHRYDRNAIASVVLIPPLGSLVFMVIWMAVFLSSNGEKDVQVIVTTAFSGASYLVTAGMLNLLLRDVMGLRHADV